MIILLIGPQACGKGTQAEFLSNWLHIPVIAVGELLRNLDPLHPRYQEVKILTEKGELAPFDLTAQLIIERASKADCAKGYILDGWGRSMANLSYFDPHPDKVLVIHIPQEESIKRISGRRICESNGKTYNIYSMSPEELSACTGKLTQRPDDYEDAVKERLAIYYTETMAVVEFYRAKGLVTEIDGLGTPKEVFARIQEAFGL